MVKRKAGSKAAFLRKILQRLVKAGIRTPVEDPSDVPMVNKQKHQAKKVK